MLKCIGLDAHPFPTNAHSSTDDTDCFGNASSLMDLFIPDFFDQSCYDAKRKAYSLEWGLLGDGGIFYDPDRDRYMDGEGRGLIRVNGHFMYPICTLSRQETFYCNRKGKVFNNQGMRLNPIGYTCDGWSIYQVSDNRCIAVNDLMQAKCGCLRDEWFIGKDGDECFVTMYPPIYVTKQGKSIYCDRKFGVFNSQSVRLFPVGRYIGTGRPVYRVGDEEYIVLMDSRAVRVDDDEVIFYEA
ncbi:MAG: hypothetical protein LBF43_00680 [Puniceicoccales bacterium]|nr:hypothetical protein [Puniceicoccales bacterium]